ncbi:MAG TPA: hypothetical protein VI299_27235 [Polyangiales bacterium]
MFGELLRSWYDAADYDPSTGSWNAKPGLSAAALAQPTFSKRPRKTTGNAMFGGLPTVDADGRDDELSASAALLAMKPNTLGILSRWPGGPANYLVGQYATTSYQFYRWDGPTEQMYADPNFKGGGYASAEIGGVHLWVFSKSGLACSVYRDGELLGTRDMASFSGSPTIFSLFSGNGAGFTAAEVAELFTVDRAISQVEARGLTEYFRNKGYPL